MTSESRGRARAIGPFALSLSLVALAGSLSSAKADDWPEWLGPERNQISRETGWLKKWPASGPPKLWEKRIGTGYSGIVVAKNRLILFHRVANENCVDSLDPQNGERQWRFSYATSYVDRYGYDGGPRCCPIVKEGLVYTLDPDGILHALDLEKGTKVWRRDLRSELEIGENHFGTGAAPLVEDGTLYFHLGGREFTRGTGYTFALDAKTGEVRWKTPNHGGSYASPTLAKIGDTKHLFVFHRGGLSSYDPATGNERWMYEWHSRFFESVNGATPLVVGDLVLFTATYGTGAVCLRVTPESYEEVWRDDPSRREKILEVHWAPLNYLDGHVYGFSGRHARGTTLNCVELATGKVKWKWESFLYRGSMIYSDGHFIALGETGDLALLELSPEGHKIVARVPEILAYPAWTVPTLANGRLYLRDLERLICLDLRAEKPGVDAKPSKTKDEVETTKEKEKREPKREPQGSAGEGKQTDGADRSREDPAR